MGFQTDAIPIILLADHMNSLWRHRPIIDIAILNIRTDYMKAMLLMGDYISYRLYVKSFT